LRNKRAEALVLTPCVWVCGGVIECAGLYQCEITCNAIDTHARKTTLTESSPARCREAMYACVVCAVVQSLLSLGGDLVPVRGPHWMRGMFVWMCANVQLYAALAQINTRNHVFSICSLESVLHSTIYAVLLLSLLYVVSDSLSVSFPLVRPLDANREPQVWRRYWVLLSFLLLLS